MKLNVVPQIIEPWIQTSHQNVEIFIHQLVFMNFKGGLFENVPFSILKKIEDSIHLNEPFLLYNRKTIDSSKRNPSELDSLRKEYDFISYSCMNAELTKWACQDQRIDSLQFSLNEIQQLADDATINLAKDNDKSIEIEFYSLLHNKYPISFLRNIKKVVFRASHKDLPIIFSSKSNSIKELRSVFSLEGFLDFIDLPDHYYLDISQSWLKRRLERNRARKSVNFVSPGIWINENIEEKL